MSKVILVTGKVKAQPEWLPSQSVYARRSYVSCTGANTGIGYELVNLLAQKGHKVYLGARNEEAGREAGWVYAMPFSSSSIHMIIVRS